MKIEGRLKNEEELLALAQEIFKEVKGGESICLSGPLGAGKTTFVRYLLRSLDAKEEASSPTYVLQHIYEIPDKNILIEHWDLYRVNAIPDELLSRPQPNTIRLIEWGERFDEVLKNVQWQLMSDYSEDGRTYIFQNINPSAVS